MITHRLFTEYFSILLISLPVLTGCSETWLEFDKMEGTVFPQEQSLGGEVYSLTSIYDAAQKDLIVDRDELGIEQLTGAAGRPRECISNEELDSIELGHRGIPVGMQRARCGSGLFNIGNCKRYHVYGVVVNHHAMYSDGTRCKVTATGRMWSLDERRALAIFYRHSLISGNGRTYLRIVAHELGHAFNLHHDDGDGSTTIMNTSGIVGNSFVYEFSERSFVHLDDHPSRCVYPGMGAFYSVTAEHGDWHNEYTTADCGTD